MSNGYYDPHLTTELIEKYCRDNAIREADFATLLGIHPGSLSRVKTGKGCSIEVLSKIARLSNRSLKELVVDAPESAAQQPDKTASSLLS